MKSCVLFFCFLSLMLMGCQKESEPEIMDETVDVSPGLDIEIAQDQKAAPPAPELVGILPSDFPEDLPLYLPSSLVDFGNEGGERYVDLLSPHSPSRVRRAVPDLLRGGGWQWSGDLARSATLRKGQQQVRLKIEEGSPGTLMRFWY